MEPGLEVPDPLEAVEGAEVLVAAPQHAAHDPMRPRPLIDAGEGREAEGHVPLPPCSRVRHRGVDEQLDGAIGGVGDAQDVFEEPAAEAEPEEKKAEAPAEAEAEAPAEPEEEKPAEEEEAKKE